MRLMGRQDFRMPLHAEDKTMLCAFDTFDHTVIGHGIDNEPATESLHGLVMTGVHVEG